MGSLLFSNPIVFFITFIALVISITIHEFAHAFVADKLGDPTPRMQGRLTLNPLAHLDPLGTIALILTSFGWGKPVQFDPYNLRNPQRDGAMIALAGPVSNLILAGIIAILFRVHVISADSLLGFAFIHTGVINILLAIFNLVPVHPLDGSKIMLALLPRELSLDYDSLMSQYGFFLLLLLIFPWYQGQSPISFVIAPIIQVVTRSLFGMALF